MKFTNDDLKRLKEISVKASIMEIHLQDVMDNLPALLARLRAAEHGVFNLETVIRWMRQEARYKNLSAADLVWLQGAENSLEAWQQSKGESH